MFASIREKWRGLFPARAVNTGRQPFLDLAKTLAVLAMVHLHLITYMLPDCAAAHPVLFLVANWLTGGVFAAPVFMFCMGIGMVYSRGQEPRALLARGGKLYCKAWVLNLLRASVLWLVLWLVTGRRELLSQAVYFAIFLDILQFAAMAFFLTALLRWLKLSDLAMLGVGAALSVLGAIFRNRDAGSLALNFLLGHFVGVVPAAADFKTIFPLFPWYIIVAAGRVFGNLLRRCRRTDRLMLAALALSAPVVLLYNLLHLPAGTGIYQDITRYYYMDLPTAIYALAAVLLALSLCFFLCRILPERLLGLCRYVGTRLNGIYCFHWIIILNLFYILGTYCFHLTLDAVTLYPATAAVLALSVLLQKAMERMRAPARR